MRSLSLSGYYYYENNNRNIWIVFFSYLFILRRIAVAIDDVHNIALIIIIYHSYYYHRAGLRTHIIILLLLALAVFSSSNKRFCNSVFYFGNLIIIKINLAHYINFNNLAFWLLFVYLYLSRKYSESLSTRSTVSETQITPECTINSIVFGLFRQVSII